jgi:hypothetical protein
MKTLDEVKEIISNIDVSRFTEDDGGIKFCVDFGEIDDDDDDDDDDEFLIYYDIEEAYSAYCEIIYENLLEEIDNSSVELSLYSGNNGISELIDYVYNNTDTLDINTLVGIIKKYHLNRFITNVYRVIDNISDSLYFWLDELADDVIYKQYLNDDILIEQLSRIQVECDKKKKNIDILYYYNDFEDFEGFDDSIIIGVNEKVRTLTINSILN